MVHFLPMLRFKSKADDLHSLMAPFIISIYSMVSLNKVLQYSSLYLSSSSRSLNEHDTFIICRIFSHIRSKEIMELGGFSHSLLHLPPCTVEKIDGLLFLKKENQIL